MIKSIKIEQFRGIKLLSIENFGKINLFLGKNNCGKTTILEAIFLTIGVTNPVLSKNIHFFRDLILTQTDDFRFLFYKLDFNSKIKIESEFKSNEIRTLNIVPKFSLSFPKNGSQVLSEKPSDVSITSETPSENIEKLVLNTVIKPGGNSKSKKYQSEISIEGTKHNVKIPDNYKEIKRGFFINSETMFQELSQKIENIIVKKQKELILEPLRIIEPKIRDISLGANGMIYFDLGYTRLMPANLLGDGIRRMFSILVKILDTNNGIVLIDEIENGLHYSSLKIFLKYLIKMTEFRDAQLFLTTHSNETLKALNNILLSSEYSTFKPEIRAITIRKQNDDRTNAYMYDYEKLEYAIEQNVEMR